MTAYANPRFLISARELHDQIGDPGLRIVDATVFLRPAEKGYRAESGIEPYREGHISGAVFMDLIREFSDTSTGLGFSRPSPEALAESLGALGIGNDHRVVVYASGHMMWATRAWWLLRYAGHDDVAVLDGGLRAWRDADLPLTTEVPELPPATFRPAPRPELFVDKEEVLAAMDDASVCTVNALSPEVYAGTGDMHYGRRGHIPGSRNVHYDELLDAGCFKPAPALEAALKDSGMLDAPKVIAYCGGGISATVDAFACLLLGRDGVAVYDGSMSEWVRDESLPLKTGEAP
tara:strand:+ start:3162 stop:4034 length:873 start_codon:yes stop_codon:yes gene_type:complete